MSGSGHVGAGTIGAMRHRLVLETPLDTPDGAGGAARVWDTVATVWAGLRPISAGERVDADAEEHAVTHRVLIRWRDDVTAGDRFRLGARIFEIRALADPEERQRFLQIDVEEVSR